MTQVVDTQTIPRRSVKGVVDFYSRNASSRMGAIDAGTLDPMPVLIALSLANTIGGARILLGQFESPEQAVLFGWSGVLKTGKITRTDILKIGAGKSGFACMRQCNETHIDHLLATRRLVTSWNQTKHELTLHEVDPSGFELEVEGIELLRQFQ